jgi:EmrB/QacA subfamily drug resistance transporter
MEAMGATEQRGTSFQTLTRAQLVGTLAGLMLSLLLASLDQTIVGTAMPRIIAQLNGFERYAWVTTAYLLTSTIAVPIFGKLSDIYGRKWFFLGGTVLFVAASALCGAAGDIPGLPGDGMTQLIVFRGIQGIGAGVITGIIFAVIGDIFPPAQRAKFQGLFAAVFGISSVFGPTLGGWITDNLSWRWVFYVNLPVGLLAIAVLLLEFPYFRPAGVKRVIDWGGVATLIAGLVPLLLALTWVSQYGWSAPRVLIGLVIAVVMLAAFLAIESRAAEPILSLALFRNRIFSVSALAVFMTGMGMFGSILFIPLFMQGVIGVSATQSGTLLTPLMLTLIVGSIVSGQLTGRTGRYRILAIGGLAIMAVGMILLAGMGVDTARGGVVRNMIVVGLGLGLTMPIYTLVVQNAVDRRMIGAATAATQFFRQIGGAVGAAVFTSIMLSRYRDHLAAGVPAGVPPQALTAFDNPLQLVQILPQLQQQFASLPNGPQLLQSLLNNVRESLVYAIDGAFLIGAVLVAVACVVNFFLPELPLRKTFAEEGRDPLEAVAAASPEDALATGEAHALPDGRLDGQGIGDGVAEEQEAPTRR